MTWEELEAAASECRGCALGDSRTNVVFGSGNKNAELMFVGEAPGAREDESGVPFVGAAGKLLDRYLFDIDILREDVYIANILKCRPPQNRDPKTEEEDVCIKFLREQVRLISPKLIVCLGRIAAMRLIRPDFKITVEHGQFFQRGEFLICAVYHPALLLRDPHKKEDMLKDMKAIRAKLDELSCIK